MKRNLHQNIIRIMRRVICLLLVVVLSAFTVNRVSADIEVTQEEEDVSGSEISAAEADAAEPGKDTEESEAAEDSASEEPGSGEDNSEGTDSNTEESGTDTTDPAENGDGTVTDTEDVNTSDESETADGSDQSGDGSADTDMDADSTTGTKTDESDAASDNTTSDGSDEVSEDTDGVMTDADTEADSKSDVDAALTEEPEESDEETEEVTEEETLELTASDDMVRLNGDGEDVKTIEVALTWSNAEEGKEIDNGYSGTSNSYLTPQAQLSINTGGQAVYEKGAVVVKVPLALYKYRDNWGQNGQTAGAASGSTIAKPADYGCPQAPNMSSTSSFNYTIDNNGTPNDESDDMIVFTNYNKISGISNHIIQWSYSLYPMSTVDMTKGELTAQLTAVNTAGEETQTEEKKSNTITYTVDTKPGTASATKEGHNGGSTSKYNYFFNPTWNAWKANNSVRVKFSKGSNSYVSPLPTTQTLWGPLPDSQEEFEKYFWETWRFNITSSTGNQPGYISIQEDLPEGAFINQVYSATSASDTAYTIDKTTNTITRKTEATNDFVYVTIAYPKELITADTTKLTNTATISYSGVDNQDDTSSKEVTGTTNTQFYFASTYSSKEGALIYTRPSSIPVDQWDTDKYAYAVWTITFRADGHSGGKNFKIQDVLADDDTYDGGEIIAYDQSDYYDWDKTTGTFSLKEGYDFLNPFNAGNLNGFSTSGRCYDYSSYARYQIKVYTRHDLSKVDEDGYLDIMNTATASATPANTMQAEQTLTKTATLRWHAFELPVNTASVSKDYFYNCDGGSTNSNYNYQNYELTALELGENCRFRTTNKHTAGCYRSNDATVIMEDDQVQLKIPKVLNDGTEKTITLDEDDYAFTSLEFGLSGTWYNKVDGSTVSWSDSNTEEMGEAPTVTLYLKQDGEWKEFRTGKLGSFIAKVTENEMPEHVTGYRYVIEHVKNTYVCLGESYVYFNLYATSPKVQELIKTYPKDQYPNPYIGLYNTARTRVQEGGTETFNVEDYISLTLNRLQWLFNPIGSKYCSYLGSDKSLRQLNYQFTLSAYNYMSPGIGGSTVLRNALKNGELPGYMDEIIFYDLLPRGMEYNEAVDPSCNAYSITVYDYPVKYTWETIDDYRGSGRQMVIFHVMGSSATATNYYSYSSYSGFQITFNAVVSWDNLRYLNDTQNVNQAAAQLPEDNSWNWDDPDMNASYKTRVHADTVSDGKSDSYITNGKFKDVLGEDDVVVFDDLNENGDDDPANTLYMSCTFDKPDVNISIQNGLTKWVKSAGDSNGGGYGLSSAVEAGKTYEYLLNLQNDKDSYMEDVVIFDILEEANGLDDYGNRTVDETYWKGTFKSINTMYPRLLGINVVVWYYTGDESLTYEQLRTSWNKGEGEGWVKTVPKDKTKIKALAIDLSKNRSGESYQFAPEQATSVTITMTAPADWQEGKAYNRAALGCTTIPITSDVGADSYKVGARTDIEMYIKSVYEKSSDPESGANAYYPTVVDQGKVITYTIKANPGVGNNGTTSYGTLPEDITVTDQLPSGLQLVEGSITWDIQGGALKDADAKPTYNASTRYITWPTYQATEAKDSTFTFKAYVTPLSGNISSLVYQNRATVKRGSTSYNTNYTYHVAYNRYISISKAAAPVYESGTLGTYVTSTSVQTLDLGQTLQYRLSGTENSVSTASYVSGEIVITDQIPANTTYVAGSIAGSINRKTSASVAEVKEMKELKDEDGNVTGLSWTLDKLSYNDTYTLTFQVVAPDSSDDPTTPDWENTKKWSNQAQLTDMQKKDAKYPESVKVVNSDGTISQINEGDLEYTESTYQKNSNTVNHRVQDTRYGFYIQKNLKKASGTEQTFVFRIDYTPSDTTKSSSTFYQTIAVPAGKTVVTRYISALPEGTYTISEVESNWRYKLSSSSNTTLTLPTQNNKTAIFTNELETDKWESDNEDVVNVMPKL